MSVRHLVKVLFAAALVAVIAGFILPHSGVQAQEERHVHSYVGKVTGSEDVFVAVVVDGENATIYICDGQAELDTVSKAEWFVGTVANGHIEIANPSGNSVVADVSSESATGQFTFTDGSTMQFVAILLVGTGDVGLFRSEFTLGDKDYVGGWLVLADGTVRGAVRDQETGELMPATFAHFQDPIGGA